MYEKIYDIMYDINMISSQHVDTDFVYPILELDHNHNWIMLKEDMKTSPCSKVAEQKESHNVTKHSLAKNLA